MFTIITQFLSNWLNYNQDKNKEQNLKSLRLVHVIFRHGKRTGIESASYPNDPYKNCQFFPYGQGALTKNGKLGCYRMGQEIRRNYGKFLGKKLLPDLVVPICSNKTRCQTSVLTVMAGLFPPNKREQFYRKLKWQPIAYIVPVKDQDQIFFKYNSPIFKNTYNKIQKHADTRLLYELYEPVFEYISHHSGRNMKTFCDIFFFYDCLKVQKEMGLTLPTWTKKVFPTPLENLATIVYLECTKTLEMRRITVEYLLRKIAGEMESKVVGTMKKPTKIFLYSGHDVTVMNLLLVLGYRRLEIPPYSSYVILELHEKDCQFFVRVLYQNYSTKDPEVVRILDKEFCPFDEFLLYIDKVFSEEKCS